jgi:DNA-binding NarL/FixJ family response regulator
MDKKSLRQPRILVVDDEPIACLGLATLIEKEGDLALCGQAKSTSEGIELMRKLKPDMAILDISVEGDRGLEFIQAAQTIGKVLIFSLREEILYAERCLIAGAKGYISKREPLDVIRLGIREVLAGKVYVSQRVQERIYRRLLRDPAKVNKEDVDSLTDRELEVFELLGQGATTQETARRLKISVKTVQGYHVSIRERLHLTNYNQLIRRAVHYILEGQ